MPLITSAEIETVGEDALPFIFLFAEKYLALISADPTGQIQQRMTAEQTVLLAFVTMDNEVTNGGFIQLIENGYGSYIFDNPLSDYLREWGAAATAMIIDLARDLYHDKKEILEKEKSLEEFARLYQEHKEFEDIEQQYYAVIDAERATIRKYMEAHLDRFAELAAV